MKSNPKKRIDRHKTDGKDDNQTAKSKKGNPFWKHKKREKQEGDDNFEEVKLGASPSHPHNDGESSSEDDDTQQTSQSYDSLVRDQNKKHKKSGGFQSMGLNPNVYKGIVKKGYKQPTPIQRKCIPILLEGRDCVAMARTGSGKTAAFLVPMFQRLKMRSAKSGFRSLILAPTRELALQTLKFAKELGKFVGLQSVVILGGEKIEDQFAAIHSNPDVIIATPGRFLHVIVEMDLNLSSVEYVVFDEADRLFELGFSDQMRQILDRLPDSHRQTLLFSATLPKLLLDFAKAGLKDPTLIRLDVETKLSENLKMAFIYTRAEDKMAALLHLLRRVISTSEQQTLIFAATKHHVELLREALTLAGFPCAFCYSSLDQAARKIEVAKFRLKKAMVMVVTDVAARGIDIPLLDNVVNFHFPPKAKVFVHRVGRVARAGSSGVAFSLVGSEEFAYMMDLHLFLSRPLQFVTTLSQNDEDGLIGGVPQHLIDEEEDIYKRISADSCEVENLEKVSANAYKMYLKSRPVASTESSKRLKALNLATATILPHPMIIGGEEEEKKAAQDLTVMLSEMKRFRPQATIFEISKSKKAEALEVMKQKRQTHDGYLAKKRRKIDEDEEVKRVVQTADDASSKTTMATPTAETASDAAIDAAFGANVIAPKNHSDAYFNKLNAEMAKKSNKNEKRRFKDEDVYVPDRAADYHTEKGLEVTANSFEKDARGATMDFTMDENDAMRMQRLNEATKKRWDRKKMKFVGQNEKQVKSGKKIKNEAGQWITASYKTDRYKKWKRMSKVESAGGGEEDDGGEGGSDFGAPKGPKSVNPAMGFRKRWHTNDAKEKKIIRDGVLSKEKILKTRMKKEAKKSYQSYRQKSNKKKK